MTDNRRDFFRKSALLSLGALAGKIAAHEGFQKLEEISTIYSLEEKKYTLAQLPYSYDALEPFIDKLTMEIHHSKHHQAYVDNLNKALLNPIDGLSSTSNLEHIFSVCNKMPAAVRNNAGGHWNHTFFWNCLKPNPNATNNLPSANLLKKFQDNFGDFESFKSNFEKAALSRFGSGWAWLYMENGKLKIGSTANQDNPLMNNAEISGKPILALDVWEHAYYLKHQNKRVDYIKTFWNIVNWDFVQSQFN